MLDFGLELELLSDEVGGAEVIVVHFPEFAEPFFYLLSSDGDLHFLPLAVDSAHFILIAPYYQQFYQQTTLTIKQTQSHVDALAPSDLCTELRQTANRLHVLQKVRVLVPLEVVRTSVVNQSKPGDLAS